MLAVAVGRSRNLFQVWMAAGSRVIGCFSIASLGSLLQGHVSNPSRRVEAAATIDEHAVAVDGIAGGGPTARRTAGVATVFGPAALHGPGSWFHVVDSEPRLIRKAGRCVLAVTVSAVDSSQRVECVAGGSATPVWSIGVGIEPVLDALVTGDMLITLHGPSADKSITGIGWQFGAFASNACRATHPYLTLPSTGCSFSHRLQQCTKDLGEHANTCCHQPSSAADDVCDWCCRIDCHVRVSWLVHPMRALTVVHVQHHAAGIPG